MVTPRRLQRRDRVRAWFLIILGALLILTGLGFAIHRFIILDIFPMAVGIAVILIGYRFLNRKQVF